MNIISILNLEKTVKDKPLFSGVTLGLENNEKVGIVGKNGCGKSTFLKTVFGLLPPDEGEVAVKNGLDMMMLEQNTLFPEGCTVGQFFYLAESRKIRLFREYSRALENGDAGKAANLYPVAEKAGALDLEIKYESMLTELGLNNVQKTEMATLSGGELKKVAIARVLALTPDLMLLDEPTNHLDIKTIEYLENYLKQYNGAVIIVTHDRYILNSVCTTIWELDKAHFYRHPGSYESYLERREERIRMLEKEQERLKSILRRELIWLARGPQARTGKDKNRKDRIDEMLSEQRRVRDAAQTSFASYERRLGKKILTLENVSKSYDGRTLFKNFTYSFKKGDRIGIVGDNGSGKSTLLDIISGYTNPDEGVVDKGLNTVFGYYDQNGRNLKSDKTVLEFISDIGEHIHFGGTLLSAARFLEIFGFPQSFHRTPVSLLSGGERRRLYLISKLVMNPNFLILDEPTNDLDLETMENLEEYISSFTGIVLIVSHDRAFLDCTTDTLLVLDWPGNGNITLYPGSYTDFRETKKPPRPKRSKPERWNGKSVKRKDFPTRNRRNMRQSKRKWKNSPLSSKSWKRALPMPE
jgi:ATPase components of ABC transporters with duplicated ATPase domains